MTGLTIRATNYRKSHERRIEYPIHMLRISPTQARPAQHADYARAKPIGEPQKVLFIYLVEDRHYRLLNDLVSRAAMPSGRLARRLS